jgi:hypothetical protein
MSDRDNDPRDQPIDPPDNQRDGKDVSLDSPEEAAVKIDPPDHQGGGN